MRIIRDSISLEEARRTASGMFGDLVKAVVDVERELVATDALRSWGRAVAVPPGYPKV